MRTVSTKCIILGHKDIGESDKFIFLYSDELGKIKAVAKGSRKITSKFTGHLETLNFCLVSLYFAPRSTIITEIVTEKNLVQPRNNYATLSNALKIAEITNQTIGENQTLENLHTLIINAVTHLVRSKRPNLIRTAYVLKLLDKAGFAPEFKQDDILNFIKTKPFAEIENVQIQKSEVQKIDNTLKTLLNL